MVSFEEYPPVTICVHVLLFSRIFFFCLFLGDIFIDPSSYAINLLNAYVEILFCFVFFSTPGFDNPRSVSACVPEAFDTINFTFFYLISLPPPSHCFYLFKKKYLFIKNPPPSADNFLS